MSEVKELKESLELQLKTGFTGLQSKYDAAIAEVEKGNKVTTDLKTQIDNQKGELQRVIDQVQDLEQKGVKLRGQSGEAKSFIDLVGTHDTYKGLQQKNVSLAEIEVTKSDLASMKEMKVGSAGCRGRPEANQQCHLHYGNGSGQKNRGLDARYRRGAL